MEKLKELFRFRQFDELEELLSKSSVELKKEFCIWINYFLDNIAKMLKADDSDCYCELWHIYDVNSKTYCVKDNFEFPSRSIIYDRLVLLHLWAYTYNLSECRRGYSDLFSEGLMIDCEGLQFQFHQTKAAFEPSIEYLLEHLGFQVEIV